LERGRLARFVSFFAGGTSALQSKSLSRGKRLTAKPQAERSLAVESSSADTQELVIPAKAGMTEFYKRSIQNTLARLLFSFHFLNRRWREYEPRTAQVARRGETDKGAGDLEVG
jgi:hypothetical protein